MFLVRTDGNRCLLKVGMQFCVFVCQSAFHSEIYTQMSHVIHCLEFCPVKQNLDLLLRQGFVAFEENSGILPSLSAFHGVFALKSAVGCEENVDN